jgi:drug/metabolite transporter (DMT)-like permease
MRRQSSAEAVLLLTIAIWSLNFTAVKVAVTEIGPFAFLIARFAIGTSITATVVFWREGWPRFRRADAPLLFAAAFFGITLDQATFVLAEHATTASGTALLVGTVPIWVALITTLFRLERVTRKHWISVAVGMGGVVLILWNGLSGLAGGSSAFGSLMGLGTAISWGVYTILLRPLTERYSALGLSVFVMVVGTSMLIPFAVPQILAQDWGRVSAGAWAGVVWTGTAGLALTNLLYFTAVNRVGATRATLFGYLQPVGGILFAVLLLHENVSTLQMIGGALVAGSLVFSRPRAIVAAEPMM